MGIFNLGCLKSGFRTFKVLPRQRHFLSSTDDGVCAVEQVRQHLVQLDAGQHCRCLLSTLERLLEIGADLKPNFAFNAVCSTFRCS